MQRNFSDIATVVRLTEKLNKIQQVRDYDEGEICSADAIAHGFADIEESASTLITTLFPKLLDNTIDENTTNDILFDIGEEIRHILYHINDMKYYQYLIEKD